MAYITASDLKDVLAAHLKLANATALPSQIDVVADQCVQAGYQEIVSRLLDRGFTQAQIDDWDRNAEFNRDLAMWFVLRHVAESDDGDLWPQKFDRREELESVVVVVDGEVQEPGSSARRIGYGEMQRSDGVFSMDTTW